MRRAVVLVALLGSIVTTLAACGGSTAGPNQEPSRVPGAANLDKLTIGISFDQPGLGLKDGDTYSGFDVETAKYVAKALGVPESGITWVQADPGNRESLLTSGAGRPGVLHLHDHRGPQAGRRLRRSVLPRTPGPAGPAQRDRDHRTGHVGRQGPVLGAGHDVGGERARSSTGGASSSRSSRGSPTACGR